jgi:hypothetical protein
VGGRLQKLAAVIAAMSAFAGDALADGSNEPAHAASAGTTAITAGWRASLFVTKPALEKDAAPFGAITTVGARLSRPVARNAHVSLDVFNILDKSPGTTDYFTATHGAAPRIADPDFFHPADGRGIRLGLKITF